MTDTLDKLLADAIRENKLLKKQLARSEYSRVQTEIGKDHTDSLQAHITEQLVAQKALVEEANLKLSLSLLAEQESRERAQISEKNARQSLEELLVAQAQLIQAEKLASLGQLIANVAHEINTPIGALKASGLMIAETLDTLLDQFPKLFAILSSQQRSLFMELVNNARTHHVALTTRDERSARKQVQQTLEDAGVDDADKKARILMDLKVRTAPLNYLELLSHIESPFILTTAQGIASIIGNTSNINAAGVSCAGFLQLGRVKALDADRRFLYRPCLVSSGLLG